jgi:hypothetical protein
LNLILEGAVDYRFKRKAPVKSVIALIDDSVRTNLRPDRRTLDAACKAVQTGT